MDMRVGDTVRLRAGSDARDLLQDLADRTGIVGDVREYDGAVRLNVLYGETGPLAVGLPAADFEVVSPLALA